MKRIMYIENKASGLDGPGRIGWVELSRSMRSFHYDGRCFQKLRSGYKYNCVDVATGERYWISGPKKNGRDRLYGGWVEIDENARQQYWTAIRRQPQSIDMARYRS
jgi:hypothetical protein